MLKNNYLSYSDIMRKTRFMTADGSIGEGTVIRLRNVEVGGVILLMHFSITRGKDSDCPAPGIAYCPFISGICRFISSTLVTDCSTVHCKGVKKHGATAFLHGGYFRPPK